jgi:hypothetical protein
MDVKQIVLLKLGKLPIEFVRIREVKLVFIKRVFKVNKIELQQLLKPLRQPCFIRAHCFPVDHRPRFCLATSLGSELGTTLSSGLVLELNAVYGVDPDSFVDFVNVVAEDNVILRLVLVVFCNPLLESLLFFGLDRLSSFVVELLRGQFQQKRLIFFELIKSIFMLFNLTFDLLYLHIDLFYLLFFFLLFVVSLFF